MTEGSATGRRTAVIFKDRRVVATCSGGGRVGLGTYVTPIVVATTDRRRRRRREWEWDIATAFLVNGGQWVYMRIWCILAGCNSFMMVS